MMPPVMEEPTDPPPVLPPPYVPPALEGLSVLEDKNPDPNVVEVDLVAGVAKRTFFGDIQVNLYAFNGQLPGPALQAKVGDEVIVHFKNDLPEPTTIHWHGLRIPADMDGSPLIQTPVQPGETFTYHFVVPEAGAFWYHPHVRANEQIEKGLYGPIVVHEPSDPTFDRERYFMIDDILLSDTGMPPFLQSGMEAMHGRNGNVLLTNWDTETVKLQVEAGTVERWRVVNTANARTMELSIAGASWKIVGTDGGRIPEHYTPARLVVPVGQRYDLEVRYDGPGITTMSSHVLTQNSQGQVVEAAIPIVEVEIAASPREPTPISWSELAPRPERAPDAEATLVLNAVNDPAMGLMWTINGQAHAHEPLLTFTRGQAVKMTFVNRAGPEHPFHLHGQFFDILTVDGRPAREPGLKDVVLVPGLSTVEILAYFDNPGRWMAHCHILEHAELGMMSEIEVVAENH